MDGSTIYEYQGQTQLQEKLLEKARLDAGVAWWDSFIERYKVDTRLLEQLFELE